MSSLLLISVFLLTLVTQLYSRRYNPMLYWLVILSTSTAGTTMSDFMDRTLGLGYATGSALLIGILLLTFAAWRLSGNPLDVTRIKNRSGELFYWVAILFSNTLGTALGDYLADDSGLGFAGGALLIGRPLPWWWCPLLDAIPAWCCSGSRSCSPGRSARPWATC
jgi:uncharacterized membrane-anchored protein